jgi:CBS domain-containing protein
MQVRDYMSPAPVTIAANADYKKAFTIMEEEDLHHIPVVDESETVVGIVTRRDLQLAARYFHEAPVDVSEVMHTPVVTIAPNADLASAADSMRAEGIGSLPVCEAGEGELVGIITESDLLRALSDLLGRG